MEENKDLFRKVIQRDEFYLSKPYYEADNYDSYMYIGYYTKVSFSNGTHLWYEKDYKTSELKLIDNTHKVKALDNLYFNAVNDSSF